MLSLLAKQYKLIFLWGLVVAVLVGVVSFVLPLSYSAESQVLIISNDRGATDPYTQAKSAERIGENLAAVIPTDDFYEKVMGAPNLNFDHDRWNNYDARTRHKQWGKDVKGEVMYGSSLVKLTVYSTSQADALNLSNAVAQTLASRGGDYVGGDITIKIVNSPLLVPFQTRPNIVVNVIGGLVGGMILAMLWILRYAKY